MHKALSALAVAALVLTVGLSVLPQPAAAHHSFALFDSSKTLALEGTVKTFEWTNPHSWITLEVPGPRNAVDEWLIELPAAGALAREGWNKNYIKTGEKLILHVNPLKDGRKGGSLEAFTHAGQESPSP